MTSKELEKLNPRSFYGTPDEAEKSKDIDGLILDGQQRITAGISIYYGVSNSNGSEYYINLNKLKELIKERGLELDTATDDQIMKFAQSIDLDDGYLAAKRRVVNRDQHYYNKDLFHNLFLCLHNLKR